MYKSVSLLSLVALFCVGALVAASADIEAAFADLQSTESTNDPALIKQKAAEAAAIATEVINTPEPESDSAKESWKASVDRARSILDYAGYAVYTVALRGPAATTVDMMAALEKMDPKSQYLDQGYAFYLQALSETGAAAKIPAIAEAGLKNLPDNEDLLSVLANDAVSKQQQDRALTYANRLVAVLSKHPKPEGMPDADWQRKKNQQLATGNYIAGMVYAGKSPPDYPRADRSLRAALPLISGNNEMRGAILFTLGVVNFQLGASTYNKARVLEAIKFSEEAASFENQYTSQAWRNIQAMKTQANQMR